jgi:uncharacterized iron-regulated membrane protein
MARWMDERWTRGLHRWLAVTTMGFLFLSVVTGLLWANSKSLYFPERYKERVRSIPAPALESASIPLSTVFAEARKAFGENMTADRVVLRADFGRLVYEVKTRTKGKVQSLILDAQSGERLSPLSEAAAKTIAEQYVPSPAPVEEVQFEQYIPRNKRAPQDAVRVKFDDANRTQIILDRHTGEIIEDEGRWRKLHFLVMQLHQLNFFGFDKTLLNFTGIPLLIMGLSGLLLWTRYFVRGRKARQTVLQSHFSPLRKKNSLSDS